MTPKQIAQLRADLGDTQQEFARRLGLQTRGAVAHLEDGRRRPTGPLLALLRVLWDRENPPGPAGSGRK